MKKLFLFYPDGHQAHFQPNHPERPERITAIRSTLEEVGIWNSAVLLSPVDLPQSLLQAVHAENLIRNLEASSKGGSLHIDTDTYLTADSWQLAINSAAGGIAVAKKVWEENGGVGMALCRPPGHHATRNQFMGFCLLNNIAIAAEYLIQEKQAKRIAIIDIDLHHGNGTQDIFYQRDDVYFFSIHQSPLYPGTGYIDEAGSGDGLGYTCNIPLPPHSGDKARMEALVKVIIPKLDNYKPEAILISIGADAHWRDPLGHQLASAAGYWNLVSRLGNWADNNCGGKISCFLEGGYDLEAGAACINAAINGMMQDIFSDLIGPSPYPETEKWKRVIKQLEG